MIVKFSVTFDDALSSQPKPFMCLENIRMTGRLISPPVVDQDFDDHLRWKFGNVNRLAKQNL